MISLSPSAYIDHHAADTAGPFVTGSLAFRPSIRRAKTMTPSRRGSRTSWPPSACRRSATAFRRKILKKKPAAFAAMGFPRFNVLGKLPVLAAPGRRFYFNAHLTMWCRSRAAGSTAARLVRMTEGGWIYGARTADMKGSIASLLLALQSLRATGTKPRLNVEVSFTADEETDSMLGTGWLVDHAPRCADYAVVMEGGELNYAFAAGITAWSGSKSRCMAVPRTVRNPRLALMRSKKCPRSCSASTATSAGSRAARSGHPRGQGHAPDDQCRRRLQCGRGRQDQHGAGARFLLPSIAACWRRKITPRAERVSCARLSPRRRDEFRNAGSR